MKHLLSTFLLAVILIQPVLSQDEAAVVEEKWTKGGFIQLNINQLSLTNWAAGGENSVSGIFVGNVFANMKEGKHAWDNSLDLSYGQIWTKVNGVRKNEDKIELNSKYGYQIADKWFAAALLNFRSQFGAGYNFFQDGSADLISYFGAPAYLSIGVGVDYKPVEFFSLYLSPATGKITFVTEDPRIDETSYGLEVGETIRTEFGAYLSAKLIKEIVKNVELTSKLDLFNNYTNGDKDFNGNAKRGNIDVDWQTGINMKVNEYITATLFAHLIYDDDIRVNLKDDDGNQTGETGPRTQFKQAFGVGFSYKF